jgi:hypothetical protein
VVKNHIQTLACQFPGGNSQPNISRSVSIPRLQCMLHLCGNDPHKSTHKHQPYANCHAMVFSSGRIPRRCYLDYSACYMLGCEAPSKGIDSGYHRVNKIGDACQSEPMHIPNISWKVGFPPTSCYLLYSACYELRLPLGLARKGKCPEMIGRMRALSFVILLQYVLHFCLE